MQERGPAVRFTLEWRGATAYEVRREAMRASVNGSNESRRARRWRPKGLWPFTLAMTAAAVAGFVWLVPSTAISGAPAQVSWWALAAGFAVTEATIIRVPVQRDAHTISLSEIPLLLGMVLAAPGALLLGRVGGSALTLAFYRRQHPSKLAFNLALFAMETVVAVSVFRLFLGDAAADAPRGWFSALTATTVAILVSATVVNAALAALRRRSRMIVSVQSFAAGIFISVGMAFVGTLCYLTVWNDVRAVTVLAGAVAMFFLLVRVYGSLTKRHDDLRAVYSFSNATNAEVGVREVVVASLREVVRLLRAEQATIVFAQDGGRAESIEMDHPGNVLHAREERQHLDALLEIAEMSVGERRFGATGGQPELERHAGAAKRSCAIISPLAMSGEMSGVLVATGRIGPDREFSVEDLELLDALASHTGLTLERALTVEQLTEEIAAKQEIIRSKDQLIAAVSHELRTPLTGILGFSELLVDEAEQLTAEDRENMLKAVAADALDMSNLVEDLLTAARARMGVLAIESVQVSLRELAHTVIEHHGGRATTITLSGDVGMARADPTRVRQILRNLIVNAERYGGDRVEMRVRSDGESAYVRVCDDGAGIPADMRERVFAPYESAHQPETQPGSLGLGLSISRTLARMMEGDLTYDYSDGWSAFEIRLPALEAGRDPHVTVDLTVASPDGASTSKAPLLRSA